MGKNYFIYFNGRYYKDYTAILDINNVGFLYGDGLFETLRSYKGNIFAFDLHLNRLLSSLIELKYNTSNLTKEFIKLETEKLIFKNNLQKEDAYIKIIVFRNGYKEKFKFDFVSKPNLVIIVKNFYPYIEQLYFEGFKIIQSSIKRVPYNNNLYRHKTLNYFENIYAKNEAYSLSANEALFLTKDKVVLECCTSNIFYVKNGAVFTPQLTLNILPGITREIVIDLCKRNKINVYQRKIHYYNLIEADEVFITNSLIEIMPVKSIDKYLIKTNKIPGNITSFLIKKYKEFVSSTTGGVSWLINKVKYLILVIFNYLIIIYLNNLLITHI